MICNTLTPIYRKVLIVNRELLAWAAGFFDGEGNAQRGQVGE